MTNFSVKDQIENMLGFAGHIISHIFFFFFLPLPLYNLFKMKNHPKSKGHKNKGKIWPAVHSLSNSKLNNH